MQAIFCHKETNIGAKLEFYLALQSKTVFYLFERLVWHDFKTRKITKIRTQHKFKMFLKSIYDSNY